MYPIKIDLGDGRKLVADADHGSYKGIFIGVEHANGTYQDLCYAEEQWESDDIPIHGKYRVFIWGDETTEEYTQEIDIKAWEEDE